VPQIHHAVDVEILQATVAAPLNVTFPVRLPFVGHVRPEVNNNVAMNLAWEPPLETLETLATLVVIPWDYLVQWIGIVEHSFLGVYPLPLGLEKPYGMEYRRITGGTRYCPSAARSPALVWQTEACRIDDRILAD
jgi:hypothetical protein